MLFLTLHELSLQFDIPVRVLRYRLRKLLQAGKLVDGQDYERADFVDDTHFVWKINPVSFMRITGLKPVTKPANQSEPLATTMAAPVNQPVNQPLPKSEPVVTQEKSPLPKVDTKPVTNDAVPELARDMISLLKDQVKVKDGQIADLTSRVREVSETNVKLIGATLSQAQQIQDLLRLAGGKADSGEIATKEGGVVNHGEPMVGDPVNHSPEFATNAGSHAADAPTAQAA